MIEIFSDRLQSLKHSRVIRNLKAIWDSQLNICEIAEEAYFMTESMETTVLTSLFIFLGVNVLSGTSVDPEDKTTSRVAGMLLPKDVFYYSE